MSRYATTQVDPLEYDRPAWDCLFLQIEELRLEHPDLTESEIIDLLQHYRDCDRAADAAEHARETRRYG
jgi:hypothetical protein